MPAYDIPRDSWVEYFSTFASEHSGWLVNLGIKGRQPGDEISANEARELPLRGITADLNDDGNTIVISVGLEGHAVMKHQIRTVASIHLIQTKDEIDSALLIESMDGHTTTIKLVPPAK
jgi:hypothetical protein